MGPDSDGKQAEERLSLLAAIVEDSDDAIVTKDSRWRHHLVERRSTAAVRLQRRGGDQSARPGSGALRQPALLAKGQLDDRHHDRGQVNPPGGATMKKQAKRARRPEARKPATAVPKGTPSVAAQAAHGASRPFPIVGIGASAGGLEALELFLKNVPATSGMAFVIVQHMDPTRKGIMAELLQRATAMEVVQVRDRTKVQPDHVYVIPPNKDMSILRGVLHLLEPTAPRGLRLPIDFFFRSLADDQQGRSIGVILSGMGADGTLGLQAIKAKGGRGLCAGARLSQVRRHAPQRH